VAVLYTIAIVLGLVNYFIAISTRSKKIGLISSKFTLKLAQSLGCMVQ